MFKKRFDNFFVIFFEAFINKKFWSTVVFRQFLFSFIRLFVLLFFVAVSSNISINIVMSNGAINDLRLLEIDFIHFTIILYAILLTEL